MYERAFVEAYDTFLTAYPGRTILFFSDRGWADDDAYDLVEALEYAATQCKGITGKRAKKLTSEDVLVMQVSAGNLFSDEALAAMHAAIASSKRLKLK